MQTSLDSKQHLPERKVAYRDTRQQDNGLMQHAATRLHKSTRHGTQEHMRL